MKNDSCFSRCNGEVGRLLVFVHIPKTAGTTLNSILAHQYLPNDIYEIMMRGMSWIAPRQTMLPRPLISFSKLRRFKSALKNQHNLQVIHGHFDMSLGKHLPSNAEFVTLLRDPVERAISHYYHYRRLTTDSVHPLAMRSTLAEWVGTRGLVEMDNGQTRRLAGEMGLPVGEVSSLTLAKAKANLANKFAVVGLAERFAESQILLHRQFKWPYCRYPARNVDHHRLWRTEVSGEILKIVEHCNRFDRELYRFAAELFEHAADKIDMDREISLLKIAPEYIASDRSEPDCSPPHSPGVLSKLKTLLSLGEGFTRIASLK